MKVLKNSTTTNLVKAKKIMIAIRYALVLTLMVLFSFLFIMGTLALLPPIRNAGAKGIKTSCTVPEMLTIKNSESVRTGNEIIYFRY